MSSKDTKAPRLISDSCLRTGVVGRLNHRNLLQQPVGFGKGPNTGFSILKALFQHPRSLKTKKDIEEFVCVTAQESASEHRNVAGGRSQCAQSIALGCISSLQLVNFVSYGVIEEAVHVSADEINRGKAANLLAIRLPKGTVEWPASMVCLFCLAQHFAQLHLLEVHRQEALAILPEEDRAPAVRIDHAALITPTAGDLVGVPPEVPKLGTVPADNE
jgi:hypothetical protein